MRSREGQEAVLDIIVLAVVDLARFFIHNTGSDRAAGPVAVQRNFDRCRAGIAAVFRCQLDVPSADDLLAVQLITDSSGRNRSACQAGSRNGNIALRYRRIGFLRLDLRQSLAKGGDRCGS